MAIAKYAELLERPPQVSMTWKAALYIRLSREDGDKAESNSITSQREILKEYLKLHPDIELYDFYVDDGWSGTSFDRPAFQRMIADIEAQLASIDTSSDDAAMDQSAMEKRTAELQQGLSAAEGDTASRGHEVQELVLFRVQRGLERGRAEGADGAGGQAGAAVRVVGVVLVFQMAEEQASAETAPHAVDDSGVGLQEHATLEAVDIYTRNTCHKIASYPCLCLCLG